MTELNEDVNNQDSNIKDVDLKAIVAKLINYWYLFLISIIICLSIAIIKGNLTAPVWKITAKILVDDQSDNGTGATAGSGEHPELASLLLPKYKIGNEIELISSRVLVGQIVRENNLNIKSYAVLQFKSIEIFAAPFNIAINYKTTALSTRKYKINILSKTYFNISNKQDKVNIKARFGDTVRLQQYNIVLTPKQNTPANNGNFEINIESEDSAINSFLSSFQAVGDEKSSTINLSYSYTHPQKGEVVLEDIIDKFETRIYKTSITGPGRQDLC